MNSAPLRTPLSTLPACGAGRPQPRGWIDHPPETGVETASQRAFFHLKANLVLPSNCPVEPDHLTLSCVIARNPDRLPLEEIWDPGPGVDRKFMSR